MLTSGFELTVFELGYSHTVPRYIGKKDFLNNFSDLLAKIMPKYNHVLVVGILIFLYVFSKKPIAQEFLNLIGSFNMKLSVSDTHTEMWTHSGRVILLSTSF